MMMSDKPPPTLKMTTADADWSCASWNSVLLLVWRGATTVARARLAMATLTTLAGAHREGIGLVVVIEPGAPNPDAEARTILTDTMRQLGTKVVGAAYLVPVGGFVGAAVRAAITGLGLMSRVAYPLKVVATASEAASWLATRLPGSVEPSELERAVEAARRLR